MTRSKLLGEPSNELDQPATVARQCRLKSLLAVLPQARQRAALVPTHQVDHSQGWTFSTGAAYTFNAGTDWATKVSTDMLFGSGLRTTVVTPNDVSLPNYAVGNASLVQKIPIGLGKGTQLRFDVINLFDNQYQIRNGLGIGIGASQFGQRQTFLLTLAQKF